MTCSSADLHLSGTELHLPVDDLNANLRTTGRRLDHAMFLGVIEHAGEVGVITRWPDGHIAFLGFGAAASAMLIAVTN